MDAENCGDVGVEGRQTKDGYRRDRLASSVDRRCDRAGIALNAAVHSVLNLGSKGIVLRNLGQIGDNPKLMGTKFEDRGVEQKLLRDRPGLCDCGQRPGATVSAKDSAWVRTIRLPRNDGRSEFGL